MNSFLTQNIDTSELEQALSFDPVVRTEHFLKTPEENLAQKTDCSFWFSDTDAPGPSSHSPPNRNEPPLFTQFPTSPSFYLATNISTGIQAPPLFSLRSFVDHENENIFASGQCSPENTLPPNTNDVQICRSSIPLSVQKLYEKITKSLSDWSFVYAVAAQLCQDMFPMDCYVNLKMGLLLSIASIQVRHFN